MRRPLIVAREVAKTVAVAVALVALGAGLFVRVVYECVRHPRQVRARMAGLREFERAEAAWSGQGSGQGNSRG